MRSWWLLWQMDRENTANEFASTDAVSEHDVRLSVCFISHLVIIEKPISKEAQFWNHMMQPHAYAFTSLTMWSSSYPVNPAISQKCRHILLSSPNMELTWDNNVLRTDTNRLKTVMKCAYEHPLCTRVFLHFWPDDFRFTLESILW